jgi:cardiolipin synthase
MKLTVPNLLTLLRIVSIPLLVGLYYVPDTLMTIAGKDLASTAIFLFAAVTDWLDGYLARRLNQTSAFGAFLDPVADKLMVTGALLILLQLGRVEAAVALVIIGREIAISALREWMAQIGQGKSVAVAFIGKVKTASQMVAIPLLLFSAEIPLLIAAETTQILGTILINVSAILTVISMLFYLRMAYPHARMDRGF